MLQVNSFDSETDLIDAVASQLISLMEGKSGQPFRLVLTGGTLGIALLEQMQQLFVNPTGLDIYWGDERWVDLDHPDRNEFQALTAWPLLKNANLHRFGAPNTQNLAIAAAEMNAEYESSLEGNSNFSFDLVLLGVGPDGHVASLFPGHTRNQYPWVVFETDSPKPPPQRLSFSYAALNASQRVWFLAAGEAKAEVAAAAILGEQDSQLPCARVKGVQETVWFIDAAISSRIKSPNRS